MDNISVYTVILDESIKTHSYLMDDIVATTPIDDGSNVYHMTCTSVDSQGNYLSVTAISVPDGEPRPLRLSHSFVVAILEVVNQQNKPGFLS